MRILAQAIFLAVASLVGSSCKVDKKEAAVSLSTVVDELNGEHSAEERKNIFESPSKVAGFQLRGRYDLWNVTTKSPVRMYFEEHGISHPDWISECILEAWRKSNSPEGLNADEVLREYADIQRQWEEWNEDYRKHPEKYASTDATSDIDPFGPDPSGTKSEQTGAGQPATRPVDMPEGSDKPQPEAEGRRP